jgi:UDP-N-acetylmuramate--alanine ligase
MKIVDIHKVYFIGIGGIGMSAIARYFNLRGAKVSGYDKTETPLTQALQAEGIEIHFEENVAMIPKDVDVVVYTPAIPKEHLELVFYQQNNFTVVKRSDMLQWITDQSKVIAVAGTHGKTTTSSIVAHLLKHSGFDCTAFLGGITANYNSNFLVGKNDWVVVEADEYDRSFLKLFPQIAVITAVDPDHLDIYKGGLADFENTFLEFAAQVKNDGKLFLKKGVPIESRMKENFPSFKNLESLSTYALEDNALAEVRVPTNINIALRTSNEAVSEETNHGIKNPLQPNIFTENIIYKNGTYHFDVNNKGELLKGFEMNVHGLYNIENALAAIAVGLELKIDVQKIKAAIASFTGVKRRFEYIVRKQLPRLASPRTSPNEMVSEDTNHGNTTVIYIDDYAHHPNEIAPFLKSVRSIYPDKKITVIFQPHLFSRTRDFAKGFSESLSLCDELILLPIYPARELPMEGITSEMLLNDITITNKKVVQKTDLMNELKSREIEVLCTIGAGDIDQFIQPIRNYLNEK